MNSKVLLILCAIILLMILGTAFVLNKHSTTVQNINTSQTTTGQTNTHSKPNQMVRVSVDSTGFKPEILKINLGDQVLWTNASGKTASVNSDVYPTNLLWKFLNLGSIDNGQSVSVVFKNKGEYKYHNQYVPTQKGEVIVK